MLINFIFILKIDLKQKKKRKNTYLCPTFCPNFLLKIVGRTFTFQNTLFRGCGRGRIDRRTVSVLSKNNDKKVRWKTLSKIFGQAAAGVIRFLSLNLTAEVAFKAEVLSSNRGCERRKKARGGREE